MEKFPGGLNVNTVAARKTTIKFKNLSCQSLYQDGVYFYGVPSVNRFLKINNYVSGTTIINDVTNPSDFYTINITQNSQTITIPLASGTAIGATINWGDGSTTTSVISHTYAVPGIYSIKVTGTIPTFSFDNSLVSNIISIPSIGTLLTNMQQLFQSSTITSLPGLSNWNTSKVTTMYQMFSGASLFNQPIGNWNTSNIIDMSFMFSGATNFNKPLNWNTYKVLYMGYMFNGATAFNQPLNWNTSNVTVMESMFTGSGLDSSNASTFLINCAAQAPKQSVTLGLSSSVFTYPYDLTTAGLAAATTLASVSYNWTIS